MTLENGTNAANVFIHAKPGSAEHKVYQNNMDKHSFMKMDEVIEGLSTKPYKAGFLYEKVATYNLVKKGLYCKILSPWQGRHLIPYSIGVNKNLQQYEAMNFATKRIIQSGLVKRLEAKYQIVSSQCNQEKQEITIGYEKVFPIFLLLLSAMSASVFIILILEILSSYQINH